jgi:thiosulfate dehydrogenase
MNNKLSFFLGIVIGLLLTPLAIYLYVHSGAMPITTADPPLLFEKFLAKTAIRAAIQKEINLKPNLVLSETQLQNGAHLYVNHCAGCHGLIDTPDSKMAAAMFPKSPQLFKADDEVTDDTVGN